MFFAHALQALPAAAPGTRDPRRFTLHRVLGALALSLPLAVSAQTFTDPLNTSPRGLTAIDAGAPPDPAAQASGVNGPGTPTAARPISTSEPPKALPLDPLASPQPVVFGSQMFTGRFARVPFSGFNPNYQISVGDKVNLRMWGAFTFDAQQEVDAQGNIFVPNVGPVRVLGIRNAELNQHVETQVKRVYKHNVGIYATLGAAQPVKVYVTGFVRAPGLYGGLSSDSILYYLDQAGGIDPDRGSYLEVDVLRAGQVRAKFNLYKFLLSGQIEHVQLQDGDTVVAHPRKYTVQVGGEVLNPYIFEFGDSSVPASRVLEVARAKPGATHLSIVRKVGAELRSEYHALSAAGEVMIQNGDEISVTSDKYPGTILVRIEGAHLGERTLVLPYGSRLKDALVRLKPAPQANVAAVQLFRKSIVLRQKEMLEASLRSLETFALTARSATSEEAVLRTREADQILKFIDRARNVQPRGQVVLARRDEAPNTLLEDGDIIRVPEQSNLVLVSGEVLFPNALVHEAGKSAKDYVESAGGFNQGADKSRLIVLRQDGTVVPSTEDASLQPGDELMVLPKIETKRVELTRGITQIIYQIAVSAKVLFGL
ncbi:polysaccharide biosynthesis/export family protein [Aquabacterium sp. A7-Y]|uniref:polysaccharide biosynthesis/export family protein n=1 Tax=Aquabacterium sp. A7-Y TaxID=1349605 RepID=UPI00223D7108|nr:polysaccharide biosynthesis/export family protein [Aquabacterium sp. A7-Y]MCW7538935.1 polysaccharide biosynthesis/export family protein [Aquabacterium sp. A7-Y]